LVQYAVHLCLAQSPGWWKKYHVLVRLAFKKSTLCKEKAYAFFQHMCNAHPDAPHFEYLFGFFLLEVSPVPDEAFAHLKRASDAGHLFATNDLGIYYLVRKFEKEAIKCFEVAANGGNVFAMYNLGVCYIKGIGGKVNLPQSRYWLQFAAEYEYPPAQSLHGHNLIDANPSISLELIRRAAKNGYFCTCEQCTPDEQKKSPKEIPEMRGCIAEAIKQKICTFTVTNGKEEIQPHYECRECGLRGKFGFCASCKEVCHAEHEDVSQEANYKPFTCCCGSSNWCSCIPSIPPRCPYLPKHSLLLRNVFLPKQAC